MNSSILRSTLAGLALFGVLMTSLAAPARADGAASTRNIIIGAAAAIIGITTAANVSNKNQQAHTVAGYLPDGSVVYADGRVVAPNGSSWYPGNQGESIACNGQYCTLASNGQNQYYQSGQNQYYTNPQNQYYTNGQNQYNGNSRNVRRNDQRDQRDQRDRRNQDNQNVQNSQNSPWQPPHA